MNVRPGVDINGNPLPNNYYDKAYDIFVSCGKNIDLEPWFGLEQEYFINLPLNSNKRYIEDNYNLKLNTLIKDGTYCTRYRTDRTLINQLIENNIYILCKESKICNTLDNCIDAIIFAYIKQTPKETYAERKERITKENNRFLREKEECATQ